MVYTVKIQTVSCSRCGHEWVPRIIPVMCPKCKTYHWNKDKDYDARKTERVYKTCLFCGKQFETLQSTKNQMYCSRECYFKNYRTQKERLSKLNKKEV